MAVAQKRIILPSGRGDPGPRPRFALRSDGGVEVGILGGDIVVRRSGWLARALRESCPTWLQGCRWSTSGGCRWRSRRALGRTQYPRFLATARHFGP